MEISFCKMSSVICSVEEDKMTIEEILECFEGVFEEDLTEEEIDYCLSISNNIVIDPSNLKNLKDFVYHKTFSDNDGGSYLVISDNEEIINSIY